MTELELREEPYDDEPDWVDVPDRSLLHATPDGVTVRPDDPRMKVETLGNVGAYLSNTASGGPTVNTVSYGTGTYKIENFEAVSKVMVTNTVPVDAYRGYGRPEGAYIAERTIEAVARHLNLDPVAVRRINFVPPSEFPYRPYGSRSVIYDSGDYQGCLDKAVTAFDYTSRRDGQQRLRSAGRYRGIGVAAYTEMCGMAPSRRLAASGFDRGGWESARVAIDSSGRATVYSGSMSQGHGHATVLAQIAADALQMPVENIDVVQGDTKQVQAGHGTFNSRSMPVGGSSVKVCAGRIVEKAKKIAAEMMEVAPEASRTRAAALLSREQRLRRCPSPKSREWRIWVTSCRTDWSPGWTRRSSTIPLGWERPRACT